MSLKCPHCHKSFTPKFQRETKDCEDCGAPFVPIRDKQKYCNATCRAHYHNSKRMEKYYTEKGIVNDLP